MTKEIYGSKATITFTMQQAIAFITEKLQDDFSSNFKFVVSIQDAPVEISDNSVIIPTNSQKSSSNPEAISGNPWLIPDKDGWFTHNPEYPEIGCPEYIEADKMVTVKLRSYEDDESGEWPGLPNNWDWRTEASCIGLGDIIKWKYA